MKLRNLEQATLANILDWIDQLVSTSILDFFCSWKTVSYREKFIDEYARHDTVIRGRHTLDSHF